MRKSIEIYLMYVLYDTGVFTRKWKSKEAVKPECFYTRFDKQWENVLEQKGMS